MNLYRNKQVLIIAQPSETVSAIALRLARSGAEVNTVEIRTVTPARTFDLSAHARLSNGLAHAEEDRQAVRKFVTGWFAAHGAPDLVLYCVRQAAIRLDTRSGGAPLHHFVASTTLLEFLVPAMAASGRSRLAVCVGLDGNDFFGPETHRLGYRALESYLKTWEHSFQTAGITASYSEFIDPELAGTTQWPDDSLTGLLRSLHPHSPDETARTLIETLSTARLGQKPLRTELLYWLSKWRATKERPADTASTRKFEWAPASVGVAKTGS